MSQPKVALIQPDSPFLSCPLSFPNLGLMYLSSHLKKNGQSVELYDLTGGGKLPDDIRADIFGFSCQITQFQQLVELNRRLKEVHPDSLSVIGGPFPTHSPGECLDAGFDAVVRGEGESALLKIVKSFPNSGKGEFVSDKFVDPNGLLPDWGALNPLRYKYQLEGRRCMNIMTKRGNCPYHCTFCASPEEGKSPLRFRTVEDVLGEARLLKDNFGFGALAIYDDEVLIGKKRDMEIFRGLQELGLIYRCMTRANLATREDLEYLKRTGCAEICVGVETADPHIHEKVIKKGTTVEQNTQFVKNCKDLGLRVKAYLMIGLPSESRETVGRTREWLRTTRPDNFDISVFTPYPGCDIYNHKSNYEIDWDENYLRSIWFSGEAQYGNCAVRTPYLSQSEILGLKKEVEQEFGRKEGGTTSYWGPIKD